MLFSILIPTYNNEKTIAKTIESALNQDYNEDFEIVIVNNASTDSTLSIIQSYNDSRIKLFTNETTVHMYENHNICIKKAQSDYVIFCHSDDELMPDALKILSKKIEERLYPKRYVVWGQSMYRDFSSALNTCDLSLAYNTIFCGVSAKKVFLSRGLTPSGTCYSRKSMIELGSFQVMTESLDSDWLFNAYAAYNCWEFEMIDRLLFKRELASTYYDSDEYEEKHSLMRKKAVDVLFELLNESQINDLNSIWKQYHSYYNYDKFNHKFNVQESREEMIIRYKNALKEKPWKLKRWVRFLRLRFNL